MLIVKWFVIVIVLLVVVALAAGQLGFLQGTPPADLGVRNGKLKPPSMTENSVTSQAALYPDHPQRKYADIAPLALKGDGPATLAKIKAIVDGMEGAQVVKSEPGYLYAQFTTKLMKYVDDVEFWFDPAANVIQVRSASGVGRGMHDHQPAHGKGVIGHVAVFALRVAHPQGQGPVREVELGQVGIVLPEQAVEERDSRLDAALLVHPHPVAVELGAQGFRGDDRAALAALGELPDDDPRRLGIDPQQNAVRRLVHAPFRLVVPERIGKL